MERTHEQDLETQAVIISNQDKIMAAQLSVQTALVDTVLPLVERMTEQEKQKWAKTTADIGILQLQLKSFTDQARAARIAYGIAPDPDDEAEIAELRALEEGNH
jgi:hypothetical protein